ncbi:MAG: hypothetical protein KAT66_06055 [Candidatus Lokiarchaeota archaeon]|nr:hypothetical protein [Candidatus Lokiarchaeota archaeon]
MKKTAKNLMKAFIHEAQARTKYEIFARIAQKEELPLISTNFIKIAEQVKEHAYWIFFMLEQLKKEELIENVKIEIESPVTYGKTAENLESAIREVEYNGVPIYDDIINTADKEGYTDVAITLKEISQIKRNYLHRFKTLSKLLQDKNRETLVYIWKCMECGYEVAVDEIPNDFICPSCGHLKQYFKREILKADKDLKQGGWICMECGYQIEQDKLPENWKCPSCKRSKEYFKRKPSKAKKERISVSKREKATWVCLECGNEEKVDLPQDWKCSVCGYPH